MRVMHVFHPGPIGGLERVVADLATGRAALGRPTAALMNCFSREHGEGLAQTLRRSGVEVMTMEAGLREYGRERRQIEASAAAWRADVVHSHGYRADLITPAAGQPWAHVSTAHGFTGGGWKNRGFEALQRLSWRLCDGLAAVSQPLRDGLLQSGFHPARVRVVRNAWAGEAGALEAGPARRVLGLAEDGGPWIGWIGRFSPEKGPDLMLRAFAELCAAVPGPASLAMVGDGPMRASLEELARRLGLGERVRFTGIVPGAARYLRGLDLLALTSYTEGTPMVLLEAMAARVPIVATRVGGVPDLLEDAEAFLCDPAAGPVQGALSQALADAGERKRRATAAQARLTASHSAEAWLRQYESLYAWALARKAPRLELAPAAYGAGSIFG